MSTERIVALVASAHLRTWIEREVSDLVTWRVFAPSVSEVVGELSKGSASRDELLVLDLDLLTAPWTFQLKSGLEERWWNGTIVGLGSLRGVHRRHLSIDRTIDRPFGSESLRAYIERPDSEDTQPG